MCDVDGFRLTTAEILHDETAGSRIPPGRFTMSQNAPAAARPFADIRGRLVFLGTGTSVGVPVVGCECATCQSTNPRNDRLRCGLALGLPEGNLLIDTTPDLRAQLLRERIGRVHAVLYTHDHVDHVYGLDDLRPFSKYLGGSVPLHCEEQVETRIRKSFDYAFAEGSQNYGGGVPQIAFHRIGLEPFTLLGQRITPLRLRHGRFQVLGFRIGAVAYCTDASEIPPESWPLLEGLDLLILDALRPQSHPTHFSLGEAVDVAQRLRPRRTLFTHMCHDLEHEATNAALPPGMELAYDGLQVPLS
jgi:phosphoribosyl 1,2-cyclic phosphate phosphodiesterase